MPERVGNDGGVERGLWIDRASVRLPAERAGRPADGGQKSAVRRHAEEGRIVGELGVRHRFRRGGRNEAVWSRERERRRRRPGWERNPVGARNLLGVDQQSGGQRATYAGSARSRGQGRQDRTQRPGERSARGVRQQEVGELPHRQDGLQDLQVIEARRPCWVAHNRQLRRDRVSDLRRYGYPGHLHEFDGRLGRRPGRGLLWSVPVAIAGAQRRQEPRDRGRRDGLVQRHQRLAGQPGPLEGRESVFGIVRLIESSAQPGCRLSLRKLRNGGVVSGDQSECPRRQVQRGSGHQVGGAPVATAAIAGVRPESLELHEGQGIGGPGLGAGRRRDRGGRRSAGRARQERGERDRRGPDEQPSRYGRHLRISDRGHEIAAELRRSPGAFRWAADDPVAGELDAVEGVGDQPDVVHG